MATVGGLSATAWLHSELSKPVHQRCADIKKFIAETSLKELHAILPALIESIFGFGNQAGWGINRISKNNTSDFNAVHQFLHPDGPLLNLIYRLMLEPVRYDFPFNCLPLPLQKLIDRGSAPALFAESFLQTPGTRPYSVLSLDAFEFYFTHFAYFLVNGETQRPTVSTNPADALYTIILEDYLNYFLPPDGRPAPVLPPEGNIKTPLTHQSPRQLSAVSGWPQLFASSSLSLQPKFCVDTSPVHRLSSSYVSPTSARMMTHLGQERTEQETWRSMTFLQILVEFWLHQTSQELDKLSYLNQLVDSFLPSVDHVRVVRMLVKHVHYFANSLQPVILSPYSTQLTNPWDNFKRVVISQFVKKKLYDFLKHSFERWPLDPSFRLVLETWLSYIQPWRYTDQTKPNKDHEQMEKLFDERWRTFIVENLLFYSVLFKSFVQRMVKTELTSAKNAYILFRVTKVFNLPKLPDVIRELECVLCDSQQNVSNMMSLIHNVTTNCLAPMSREHGNLLNVLMNVISELEGPSFQLVYLFSSDTRMLVQQLLQLVVQAKESATVTAVTNSSCSESFLSWFWVDSNGYNSDIYDDGMGVGDARKVELHLNQATRNLCQIFKITLPEKSDKGVSWGASTPGRAKDVEHKIPDVDETEMGPELGPLARYQLMNGLRKFEIVYEGDPDLQPIRSHEITWLVRALYHITNYFNTRYREQLMTLYNRQDFIGRLCRVFLSPPTVIRSPDKLKALSPRAQRCLRQYSGPRLSLRHLASYHNILLLGILYCLSYYLLGFGPILFIIALILITFLYASLKALLMFFQETIHSRTDRKNQ